MYRYFNRRKVTKHQWETRDVKRHWGQSQYFSSGGRLPELELGGVTPTLILCLSFRGLVVGSARHTREKGPNEERWHGSMRRWVLHASSSTTPRTRRQGRRQWRNRGAGDQRRWRRRVKIWRRLMQRFSAVGQWAHGQRQHRLPRGCPTWQRHQFSSCQCLCLIIWWYFPQCLFNRMMMILSSVSL